MAIIRSIKNRTLVIVLAILLLCVLIIIIALISTFSDEIPKKAVYVMSL